MPTHAQLFTAVSYCQLFSNCYQPIQVFRYDEGFKTIYIQAGDGDNVDIALVINEDGIWEFV
ncbi:MAG: hypothetical protein F6J87_15765 [Spirulina sp. SIO3F2]|nr:hypothetical protein [Spirulina sp. SIO3F2]